MSGAIPPLSQYAIMAWCLVKAQGQLYLYLYLKLLSAKVNYCTCQRMTWIEAFNWCIKITTVTSSCIIWSHDLIPIPYILQVTTTSIIISFSAPVTISAHNLIILCHLSILSLVLKNTIDKKVSVNFKVYFFINSNIIYLSCKFKGLPKKDYNILFRSFSVLPNRKLWGRTLTSLR
jgi:hypothetical protein